MVQAYNYRICLTNDPQNMLPITKPDGYDSTWYEITDSPYAGTTRQNNAQWLFFSSA